MAQTKTQAADDVLLLRSGHGAAGRERELHRSQRLASITAAIADAVTEDQVYEALIDHVAEALGASSAALWIVADDGRTARLARSVGYTEATASALTNLDLARAGAMPVIDAIRSGRPVSLGSQSAMLESYPHLAAMTSRNRSYAVTCVPLRADDRIVGGLGFTFEQPSEPDPEREYFVGLVARYSTQALERRRLVDSEKHSRKTAEELARKLALLSGASRALAEAGPHVSGVLQTIVEIACRDFADLCSVSLTEADGSLRVAAIHHHDVAAQAMYEEAVRQAGKIEAGEGLTGKVALAGEALLIRNVDRRTLLAQAKAEYRAPLDRFPPASLIAVPMRARGKLAGVMLVQRSSERPSFTEQDLSLLEDLADRAAMAIENARLYEAVGDARSRAELLYELTAAINQAESIERAFEAAISALMRGIAAPRASVLTFDAAGVMRFRVHRGLSDAYRTAVDGHAPWPRDVQSPLPIFIEDAGLDPAMVPYRAIFEREGIVSLAFVPLFAAGRLLGKFMVYFNERHEFLQHEREMLAAIADHVAAAILRFQSIDELQRTVRFNETFSAILGHDLRNPLSGMIAAAQLIKMRDEGNAFTKQLDRIVSSGGRMSRMIDQLLDFSRLRLSSGIPTKPAACDALALIREVVDELTASRPDHRVAITSDGDCSGTWDADRLAQVFSNLIANALVYGDHKRVDVALFGTEADRLEVVVTNPGGIDETTLRHLFEPMSGDRRRSARADGLGLGLYITRQIVRGHGGDVSVRSEAGTVSFFVQLPRNPQPRNRQP